MPAKHILAIASVLHLCACAGPSAFVESNETSAAKLRIRNANVDHFTVAIMAADPVGCSVTSYVGWLNGGSEVDRKRAGMMDDQGQQQEGMLERRIAPGKAISFVPQILPIIGLGGTSLGVPTQRVIDAQAGACSTPQISPKDGEELELVYDPSPGKCIVTLIRLTKTPDGRIQRQDISHAATKWITPVLGTYIRGVPNVSCRDS